MKYAEKTRIIKAAAAAVAAGGLLALSACGGGGSSASANLAANDKPAAANGIQIDVLTGKLSTKFDIMGPDGRGHDTFAPSELTLKAGQTYQVTVYNYDEGAHTFTVDALGINQTIAPGSDEAGAPPVTTTFTLKIDKPGTYRFYCKLPCDAGQGGWAMQKDTKGAGDSQDGFMAGYVNVISA